jgi:hypothetical protein
LRGEEGSPRGANSLRPGPRNLHVKMRAFVFLLYSFCIPFVFLLYSFCIQLSMLSARACVDISVVFCAFFALTLPGDYVFLGGHIVCRLL